MGNNVYLCMIQHQSMKRILTFLVLSLALSAPAWAQDTAPKINKKNLVIKEWKTDPKSGSKSLDHLTTFDAAGKKIEEIEYNSYGQKWRKRYEYGADGKCTRGLLYNERNKLETVRKYEYNEFGRKKTQYNYDPKGKLVSIKVFEYLTEDA